MSRLCPQYVQPMSRLCPCPMYDQILPSISNFCPCQIQYLSFWANICPQFGLLGYQNWWKICRTKSSQTLDMTIYAFTIWLPCKWTKLGQSMDSGPHGPHRPQPTHSCLPHPQSLSLYKISRLVTSHTWPAHHPPNPCSESSCTFSHKLILICSLWPNFVFTMSTVCLSGHGMDSGWAVGGLWVGRRRWAQGPFLGLPKAGHKLDMYLTFVQNLAQQGIL